MKTAKLFKNGQNQVVQLSKEFRFEGKKVFIKKMGNATILLPVKNPWASLLHSLNKFSSDFMSTRKQLKHQTREDL